MNNKNTVFLLISGLIFFSHRLNANTSLPHPYYVSVTEVKIDTHAQTLQVSCRMFIDDLEEAVSRLYDIRVDILKSVANQPLVTVLDQYLRQHLTIQVGGVFQNPELLGYEIEDEAVWCYLELNQMSQTGLIKISNTILFQFIPTQTNIIHCYYNGVRKSMKLVNPESEALFEF